jgi:UDP-N-acetyl-D-glucosamine dehydrogenase
MSLVFTLTQPGALARKLDTRTARVAVAGLGYVGLPLIHSFWRAGIETMGVDSDPEKIAMIACSESYLGNFSSADIEEMHMSGRFFATVDFSRLSDADVVLICAPKPIAPSRGPDLRYLIATVEAVAKHLRRQMLVVLESAIYPGTTMDIVLPILERSGLKAGRDFYLAFSGECPDGHMAANSCSRIVGGIDEASGKLAAKLYKLAFDEVRRADDTAPVEAAG